MSPLAVPCDPVRPSLGERWLNFRNRLIASPKFQRWAADFPLTRGVARRRARALFDMCAGFVYSQTLAACVKLDLFAHLADGPQSAEALGRAMRLSDDAARRLLRAAAALELIRALPRDRYALDDLGAAMLANPGVAAMIAHHKLLYDDLRDPVALLRGEVSTRLSQFWLYADSAAETDGAAGYSALMSQSQSLVAEDILDAFPVPGAKRWLDVGGGEGAFAAAVAARDPRVQVVVFDLAPVTERARREIARRNLSHRIETVSGRFPEDALPAGADVISLVRVLHDHDDAPARKLLARIHAALPVGGTVLIAEPMAQTPGAETVGDAYFGLYLLAMGRGRPRTALEISAMLHDAGFIDVRPRATRRPLLVSALSARKT